METREIGFGVAEPGVGGRARETRWLEIESEGRTVGQSGRQGTCRVEFLTGSLTACRLSKRPIGGEFQEVVCSSSVGDSKSLAQQRCPLSSGEMPAAIGSFDAPRKSSSAPDNRIAVPAGSRKHIPGGLYSMQAGVERKFVSGPQMAGRWHLLRTAG